MPMTEEERFRFDLTGFLVLHRGRLRKEGRHQELLARDGIYARLHQLQYSEALA